MTDTGVSISHQLILTPAYILPFTWISPEINLKVHYLNSRSLKSFKTIYPAKSVRYPYFMQELVYRGDYKVICISETWLNYSDPDSELLPGFNIFRGDRKHKIGDYVLIVIAKYCLKATRRCELERHEIELAIVQLRKTNNKPDVSMQVLVLSFPWFW